MINRRGELGIALDWAATYPVDISRRYIIVIVRQDYGTVRDMVSGTRDELLNGLADAVGSVAVARYAGSCSIR